MRWKMPEGETKLISQREADKSWKKEKNKQTTV